MALMNSFYGGRRGASFVIVKNYLDVLSMVTDFSRGNDFTEVKFDEYVIINNPNKNHPDNGKIFRRGYDYNSDRTLSAITLLVDGDGNYYQNVTEEKYKNLLDTDSFITVETYQKNHQDSFTGIRAAGAEYIGCIVGPAGKAPLLNMESYAQVNARSTTEFEYRKTSGEYSPNSIDPGLIPGKDNQGNFHDNIEWVCFSIRNDQYGDDTQAYIGFKFPYLITQMQTSQVEPYDTNGDIADMSDIFRASDDDGSHPYYNKWHLHIPKGVKGDTFKNLKVTTYREWLRGLSGSADRIMYDATQSGLITYTPGENDLDREILIYEDWNYNNKQNGQVKYYYLGDYNHIDTITFENGILTFSFTHDDDISFIFDYISRIELAEDGTLTFVHSILENGQQKKDVYANRLQWISNVSLDTGSFPLIPVYEPEVNEETGDPLYDEFGNPIYKTDQTGNPIQARDENGELVYEISNWVENANPEGLFKVTFNNGNEYRAYIPFVNNIEYDENSGWIGYHIIGPNSGHSESLIQMKFIKKILQDETTGKIIIVYNIPRENAGNELTDPLILDTEMAEEIKEQIDDREYQAFPLKTLQNIWLDEETGNLNINYINGDTEVISSNIYSIDRFEYDPQESNLYIKRSIDEEVQVFPIHYPSRIRYNIQNDNVEYLRAGENNYTQIGTLPLLKDIQLTDNLDLYVQMNNQTGYDIISDTEFSNDSDHPTSQYWINLGNLSKTLPVMGIARNYNREELRSIILENELWGTAEEYATLRTILADTNEYTKHKLDVVVECLNLIYPDGLVSDIDPSGNITTERFRLITAGESSELKDFFAFDQFKNKTVYQRVLVEDTIQVRSISQAGSWYFLGRIQTGKNTAVGKPGENINLPQAGGILLTKKQDICSISFPDTTNPLVVQNKMKEIKLGSKYRNKIYNIAASENLIIEMTGTDNASIQSYFNASTKEIYIPEVKGDITIRRG